MEINSYISELYQKKISLDYFENKILSLAKKNNIPFLSVEKSKILESVILIKNPKKCLEIGLGSGFSTYTILKSISANSKLISTDFNFFRVDLFFENIFKELPVELRKKLQVYPLEAIYLTDKLVEIKEKFDFIFMDSTKRDYLTLLPNLLKLLNEKGVLLVDNISYSEQTFKTIAKRSEKYIQGINLLKEFNEQLLKSNKINTSFIPVQDGMSLSIKLTF